MSRCTVTKPAYPGVQCVKPKGEHYEHLGWIGDDEVLWSSRPTGPETDVGWMAAAWALTDLLGLEVRYDSGYKETDVDDEPRLVIDGDDFKKWWDTKQESILTAWERRHERTTLGEQLREVYDKSPAWHDPIGTMRKYCPVTDCGCDGNAH